MSEARVSEWQLLSTSVSAGFGAAWVAFHGCPWWAAGFGFISGLYAALALHRAIEARS